VDRRDHVGRTPLHVAILAGAEDIACDLINAGARISPRLVDGRSALHLAARMDMVAVVRKLLEKSAINAEAAKKAEKKAKKEKTVQTKGDAEEEDEQDEESDCERPSSEDDWSSEEEEKPPKKLVVEAALPAPSDDIPEDDAEAPDVLEINAPDWDHAFTPLLYCILYGSFTLLNVLLDAGADVKLLTKASSCGSPPLHPLTVTLLRPDEEVAANIAARLIQAGASSSTADEDMVTILHRAVLMDKTTLVAAFLRHDPNATAVVNFPTITWGNITPPINTAIASGNYAMVAVLLAHGAKLVHSQEDVERALATRSVNPFPYHASSLMLLHMQSPKVNSLFWQQHRGHDEEGDVPSGDRDRPPRRHHFAHPRSRRERRRWHQARSPELLQQGLLPQSA
jgi:ankyrin repeat protein